MTKRALRVVHLAYYYGNNTSGAPVAATRLHQALLRAGVDSHFVCVEQRQPGVNVHAVPHSRIVERLFYVITRSIWVLTRLVFGRIVMANAFPLWGFDRVLKMLKPDIIHVLIGGQIVKTGGPELALEIDEKGFDWIKAEAGL